MVLGHCAVEVTRPKLELVGVVLGALNWGWFKALMNSVRNCSRARSVIPVFFTSEISQLSKPSPGCRRSGLRESERFG